MYGLQLFPTRTDATHLSYLLSLRNLFQLPVGYQDHSDGGSDAAFWLPAAAIGMGVDIVEKHITHDRSFKGIDYEAALNPDEFVRFMAMVREIDAAMGDPCPRPFSPEEMKYRKYCKKSIVAARDLVEGRRSRRGASISLSAGRETGSSAGPRNRTADRPNTPSAGNAIPHDGRTRPGMKVGALITARLKSTRLPRKAILEIEGRPALAHLIDRYKLARRVDEIVVCTSSLEEDLPLVEAAEREGVKMLSRASRGCSRTAQRRGRGLWAGLHRQRHGRLPAWSIPSMRTASWTPSSGPGRISSGRWTCRTARTVGG